ncbi:hypothetical protein [Pedobacter frigoris]|uniref:hypothetical protein n=1 Tax=Pedobacter frigoris TaxID=2571272 RepID=UPI002930C269|nr:hypothetical protein [Pedobacter frigoris]
MMKQKRKSLIVFFLALSLFSVYGSAGLTSFQLQKTGTELLWPGSKQTVSSAKTFYDNLPKASIIACAAVQEHQKGALLFYNRIVMVKFSWQTQQFEIIKASLLDNYHFLKSPASQVEPSIS